MCWFLDGFWNYFIWKSHWGCVLFMVMLVLNDLRIERGLPVKITRASFSCQSGNASLHLPPLPGWFSWNPFRVKFAFWPHACLWTQNISSRNGCEFQKLSSQMQRFREDQVNCFFLQSPSIFFSNLWKEQTTRSPFLSSQSNVFSLLKASLGKMYLYLFDAGGSTT